MALRIGQPQAASYPAVLPEEPAAPEVPMDMPAEAMPEAPMTEGSAVEWLQEAIDLCKQYQCPEELAYALEQSLVHLIGPSAVGATEAPEPEAPAPPPAEEPAEEPEE